MNVLLYKSLTTALIVADELAKCISDEQSLSFSNNENVPHPLNVLCFSPIYNSFKIQPHLTFGLLFNDASKAVKLENI